MASRVKCSFVNGVSEEEHGPKGHGSDKDNGQDVSARFRQKLNMFFGQQLSSNVVDELCNLAQENSYGKCLFCMLPTESLILSVVQILLDAGQIGTSLKEQTAVPQEDFPEHCSQQFVMRSGQEIMQSTKRPRIRNLDCTGDMKNGSTDISFGISSIPENVNASRQDSDYLGGNLMKKPFVILDTPLVMQKGHRLLDELSSKPADASMMHKKGFFGGASKQISSERNVMIVDSGLVKDFSVQPKASDDVEFLGVRKFGDRCLQLGKLTDDLYNKRTFSMPKPSLIDLTEVIEEHPVVSIAQNMAGKAFSSVQRFVLTDEERGYYNVICGLAYSQWSCFKAVDFCNTSVTYSSLGESVEPKCKVDNFFIAGFCRKFFVDVHPRQSKKHFFYPKVGGCLYTYNCSYDINTVQKCFLGANSAYKLHLSDKLCFPVILHDHWFVFIVDLKNKHFVFLDSYFGCNDRFQIEARSKLF